jgi:CBS domain-containing protein
MRPGQNVSEAAMLMETRNVGTVIVAENGTPLGIITDRDLALAVAERALDPYGHRVDELMHKPVITVAESTPLREAIRALAQHGLRRLPVVDADEHLVGMIAADDIVPLLADELALVAGPIISQAGGYLAPKQPSGAGERKSLARGARRHFLKDVASVTPTATGADIARLMRAEVIGCVVVTDVDGCPIGIITDRDLMRRAPTAKADLAQLPARELMSQPVVTIGPEASLEQVTRLMLDHEVQRIPVVESGTLVGLVSLDDILVTLGHELADVGVAIRHGIERSRRDQRLERLRSDLHRAVDWSLDSARQLGEKAQERLARDLETIREQLRHRRS